MTAAFQPGFRISRTDIVVLVAGAVAVAWTARIDGWTAAAIGFVVAHFFLFCNVVRMGRSLELPWAGLFVALAVSTVRTGVPGWPATFGVMLAVTIACVVIQVRKPSYHGVLWRRINPGLPAWWSERKD